MLFEKFISKLVKKMPDKNPLFILIETATQRCSVALSDSKGIILEKVSLEENSHSKQLSLLIDSIMKEANCSFSSLSAIAVGKGPGSYTGLRIGVSTAKGLAYGLDIPLIGVDTLRILQRGVEEKHPKKCTVAMIDARRMEVYCEIYDENGQTIKPLSADIIEKGIYDSYLKEDKDFVFVGDGAEKAMDCFKNRKNVFYDSSIQLTSSLMQKDVFYKFNNKEFEDVAYFEPYYLKDFIAKVSLVKGLY